MLLGWELYSEILLSTTEWNDQSYFMSGVLSAKAAVNFLVASRYMLTAMGQDADIPLR